MLVTKLDLNTPMTRAMIGLLGYISSPFQLIPIGGSKLPIGAIELPDIKVFIIGVVDLSADDVSTIERIVRASGYDCIIVGLGNPDRGPAIKIDVVHYASVILSYNGGLELFDRFLGEPLLINTRLRGDRHGLRITRSGLMPTNLPRLDLIEGLRSSTPSLRRVIWGCPTLGTFEQTMARANVHSRNSASMMRRRRDAWATALCAERNASVVSG